VGDTELLLARHVGSVHGIDLSKRAIVQARSDAAERKIMNAEFTRSSWRDFDHGGRRFDMIIAVFFLHHLSDDQLSLLAWRVAGWLKPGGCFYSLDPSRRRLSGAIGERLFPALMHKHQTPDEHPLLPGEAAAPFKSAGLTVQTHWYDFVSTPLAGLFPSWRSGYRIARIVDEVLIRTPLLRSVSSNFEIVARS
jgi:cyclopropane fatty-acyl-phospholipid synthase-like methyltransferase